MFLCGRLPIIVFSYFNSVIISDLTGYAGRSSGGRWNDDRGGSAGGGGSYNRDGYRDRYGQDRGSRYVNQ